jgi:hypothetical protein
MKVAPFILEADHGVDGVGTSAYHRGLTQLNAPYFAEFFSISFASSPFFLLLRMTYQSGRKVGLCHFAGLPIVFDGMARRSYCHFA